MLVSLAHLSIFPFEIVSCQYAREPVMRTPSVIANDKTGSYGDLRFDKGLLVKNYFQHTVTYTPISPHSSLSPQGLFLTPTELPIVVYPRFWDCRVSDVARPRKQSAFVIFA